MNILYNYIIYYYRTLKHAKHAKYLKFLNFMKAFMTFTKYIFVHKNAKLKYLAEQIMRLELPDQVF